MRGPPSVAWTTSDEGQRQCCLDNGTPKASGPVKEVLWLGPKSPQWSAGRRARRSNGARHRKVQMKNVAPFGAPLPSRMRGQRERKAQAPRRTMKGADESRL